jgi:hypothetical protein
MSEGPDFEEYLKAKKIDSAALRAAEPELWTSWKNEFEVVHPNSFTMQKLNLINAIRRKYLLASLPPEDTKPAEPPTPAKPRPGKPVMRPKMG